MAGWGWLLDDFNDIFMKDEDSGYEGLGLGDEQTGSQCDTCAWEYDHFDPPRIGPLPPGPCHRSRERSVSDK